ncbi:MAG: PaaI family thioesterase [Rhodoferax sp.]|nr:PaaI family thioesterase [Rhodoferax sp.]
MTNDEIIALFNHDRPACLDTLSGRIVEYIPGKKQLTMQFEPGLHCCHSGDIVQGGFVTAMLDAAMAHAILASEQLRVTVSSIDINVSFLRPTRSGRHTSVGTIIKLGRSIGYARAELYSEQGELTATATSSVHLKRHHLPLASSDNTV